jgi:adenylate kinase
LVQAESLHQFTSIDYIIDIDVAEEKVVERLSGRRVHPASGRIYHIIYHPPLHPNQDDVTGEALVQRADDQEETIRKRLAVYQAETSPLRHFYQNFTKNFPQLPAPMYLKVDGSESVEEVSQQIISKLTPYKDKESIK